MADSCGSFGSQDHEIDIETELLMAKLALEDIQDVEGSRKGKARFDAPPTDEELALRAQADSLQGLIGLLADRQLALSIDRALETDWDSIHALCVLDQAEHDDREAARTLERENTLPPTTAAQQATQEAKVNVPENGTTNQQFSDIPADIIAPSGGVKPHSHYRAKTTSGASSSGTRDTSRTTKHVECLICADTLNPTKAYQAPCSHHYCWPCLSDLVEAASRDETLFPLRCCRERLPVESVLSRVSLELQMLFRGKVVEFSIPSGFRIYCSNPRCSVFLGESGKNKPDFECQNDGCRTATCALCKSSAHPGEGCAESVATREVMALAAAQGWKTCPGCNAIVELSQGCYHMTCRCSAQFCYLCTARWKTCRCVQWEEDRLLADAERRVQNQHGVRAAAANPERHQERIRRQVEELRQNHDCLFHNWTYRHGPGHCEECGHDLPMFLMRCTGCQMLVCKRCSHNRL